MRPTVTVVKVAQRTRWTGTSLAGSAGDWAARICDKADTSPQVHLITRGSTGPRAAYAGARRRRGRDRAASDEQQRGGGQECCLFPKPTETFLHAEPP